MLIIIFNNIFKSNNPIFKPYIYVRSKSFQTIMTARFCNCTNCRKRLSYWKTLEAYRSVKLAQNPLFKGKFKKKKNERAEKASASSETARGEDWLKTRFFLDRTKPSFPFPIFFIHHILNSDSVGWNYSAFPAQGKLAKNTNFSSAAPQRWDIQIDPLPSENNAVCIFPGEEKDFVPGVRFFSLFWIVCTCRSVVDSVNIRIW